MTASSPQAADTPKTDSEGQEAATSSSAIVGKADGFNISNDEAVRRLRAKGQPIRLFDESDRDRRLRLRALELLEERGGNKQGAGLNDFRRVMEHMEQGLNVEDAVKRLLGQGQQSQTPGEDGETKAEPVSERTDEEQLIDLGLIKSDPEKLYPLIYYAIKRKLKEWEQSMAERPGWYPTVYRHHVESPCLSPS